MNLRLADPSARQHKERKILAACLHKLVEALLSRRRTELVGHLRVKRSRRRSQALQFTSHGWPTTRALAFRFPLIL